MARNRDNEKVGVLVARFQAHKLHAGWRRIIDIVRKKHPKKMLIVLGDHGGERTEHDPLTFEERKLMVRQKYPQTSIKIVKLYDNPISNKHWSKRLDALIRKEGGSEAVLYGSRKSFIPLYTGVFPTVAVSRKGNHSGTSLRNGISMPETDEERAGAIYAVKNRRPIVYSTVDVIIHDPELDRVLLITKDHFEGKWSFPGGFADPTSNSDLHDAKRERKEEVRRVKLGPYTFLGRVKMNDPRYRASIDTSRTALFTARYVRGKPLAGDDAEQVKWFPRKHLKKVITPWHRPLARKFEKFMSG